MMYDSYGQVTNHFGAGQYPVYFELTPPGIARAWWTAMGIERRGLRQSEARSTQDYADDTYYEYTYDRNGNLRTRRDAKGVTTTYSYDADKHVTRVDYPRTPMCCCVRRFGTQDPNG